MLFPHLDHRCHQCFFPLFPHTHTIRVSFFFFFHLRIFWFPLFVFVGAGVCTHIRVSLRYNISSVFDSDGCIQICLKNFHFVWIQVRGYGGDNTAIKKKARLYSNQICLHRLFVIVACIDLVLAGSVSVKFDFTKWFLLFGFDPFLTFCRVSARCRIYSQLVWIMRALHIWFSLQWVKHEPWRYTVV